MKHRIIALLATGAVAALALIGGMSTPAHAATIQPDTSSNSCPGFPYGGTDCFQIHGTDMFVTQFSGQDRTLQHQLVFLDGPAGRVWSGTVAPGATWALNVDRCEPYGTYTAYYYDNGSAVHIGVSHSVEVGYPPTGLGDQCQSTRVNPL